ncbi:hypothetical protein JCM11251_006029 [Rhodosporidiobolus azoricus]
MSNDDARVRELEAEVERLRRVKPVDERAMATAVILAQEDKRTRSRRFLPKITNDSNSDHDLSFPSHTITAFANSPISVPPDLVKFFGRTHYLPAYCLLTPEFVHQYNEHSRAAMEPNGSDGRYDNATKTMNDVYIPLDSLLPFEEWLSSFQLLMRLVLEVCVDDSDKEEVQEDFVLFLSDIIARNISDHSWEVYREYVLAKTATFRQKLESHVPFSRNRLFPFDKVEFDRVAGSFGQQGSNLEALFSSRTRPGPSQSAWGAVVKSVCEKEKPAGTVKTLVSENKAISREVFDRKEAKGRMPPSLGYRKGPPSGPTASGFGGPSGGGGGGGFGRNRFPNNAPFANNTNSPNFPANHTPLASNRWNSPGASPSPSSPGSPYYPSGQNSSYSGSPPPSTPYPYSGGRSPSLNTPSPRSSPYPSSLGPNRAKQEIRSLYTGSFLFPIGWNACIYCGREGHDHNSCPQPFLRWAGTNPKQVFAGTGDTAVCTNANRSICPKGPAGTGCPRDHVCSLCGGNDHFAACCPRLSA